MARCACPTHLHSKYIRTGPWRLFVRYAVAGADAPWLVLVHGFGVSSRYFRPLMRRLGGAFNLLAPDLPGYGRSTKPPHALSPLELARMLERLMDSEGIAAASFLGNSAGCQAIARLAALHPERLRAAVLVGPTVDLWAASFAAQFVRLALDVPREPIALLAGAAIDYLRFGSRRAWQTTRLLLAEPPDAYAAIRCPALIVRGASDPLISERWAERLAELLPHARMLQLPGHAHGTHHSAADAVAFQTVRFLASVGVSAPALPLAA